MMKWDGDDGYGPAVPFRISRARIAGVVLLFAVAVVWFH